MLRIPPELLFSGLGGLLGGSLDDFLDRLLDNLGLGRSDLVVRAADEQLHRRLDVAVQRDGHLVLAGRLDGVAQLDAATIDVDVRRGLDGIGDHLSGNGTEQLTLFAHLGFDLDERAVERFLDLAGVGKAVLFALGLKVLAKEMDMPVIALSQLSRAVEMRGKKRPMLSDLRESGSIEQDADIVMFIDRSMDEIEAESEDRPDLGSAELIVAKHRNGPTRDIPLAFNAEYTRFMDFIDDSRVGGYM